MPDLIYQGARNRFEIDKCVPQRSAIEAGKVGFHALSHGHYPGTLLGEHLLSGISSMGYFDVVGEQDWGMDAHRNEGIEICLQETGRSDLIVDGVCHKMPAGTLSITRPWQLHQVGNPHIGPGRIHWIILDVGVRRPNQPWTWPAWCILSAGDRQELTAILRGNEHPVWTASAEILRVFRKLGSYVAADDPASFGSRIMVTLNQLLLALLDLLRSHVIEPDDTLTTRRRNVDLFLRELRRAPAMLKTMWTLERMARHCGMGRTAFAGYCHELTNTTPIDFLNRCRLENAARRLASEPDVPISAIALESGFSSSQYFCRRFKAHFGKAPGAWRAREACANSPTKEPQVDRLGAEDSTLSDQRVHAMFPQAMGDQASPSPRSGWHAVKCAGFDDMRTQNVRFWQMQGGKVIRQAAWELVEDAWRAQKRNPDELRFQRSVTSVRRA